MEKNEWPASDADPTGEKKRKRVKRRCFVLFALLLVLAVTTVVILNLRPKQQTYDGNLLLSDGMQVPCEADVQVRGGTVTLIRLALPFEQEVRWDEPVSWPAKENEQPRQLEVRGLPVALTLKKGVPETGGLEAFSAARQNDHVYIAVPGAQYHTAAYSCAELAGAGTQAYCRTAWEARLYGAERCTVCLEEDGSVRFAEPVIPPVPDEGEGNLTDPGGDALISLPSSGTSSLPSSRPEANTSKPAAPKSDTAAVSPAGGKICKWDGCGAQATKKSAYCSDHVCKWFLCLDARLPDCRYCSSCKCKIPDCKEAGMTGGYCTEHVCRARECRNPHIEGDDYCRDHICHYKGCNTSVRTAGGYCAAHTCRVRDCDNARVSDYSAYCENHTCAAEGCNQLVMYGGYCDWHKQSEASK